MSILIHDLKEPVNENIVKSNSEETVIISDDGKIKPCVCCFTCWVKTPGQCVIKDGYEDMGRLFSKCGHLFVISRCFYGGYSPFVKNVLDRAACPYLLPYFKTKNGETHHPKRYKNEIAFSAHFYGEISEGEKETARKLVKANEINMFKESSVYFYNSSKEIKGV